MPLLDVADLDAVAQAELVRRGEVTPLELVEAAIARIERLDPRLNAVIHRRFERARDEARAGRIGEGPFRGVPFLLKDLLALSEGDPYHMGLRPLRDLGLVAPYDSALTRKFRSAGFVFLGRTNVPELGTLPTTESDAYGPCRNPWDPRRSPGGSSGGSAAAVASGMVPAAHGNDGGGSIRIPASACGVVGLKPSRGRTSFAPDLGAPVAGLVVEGVVTRSVRDTAAILDAISGPMPGDPIVAPPPARPFRDEVGADPGRLRIGLMARAPGNAFAVHPDCTASVERAARLLRDLGHTVEVAHPAALDDPELGRHFTILYATHGAHTQALLGRLLGRPLAEEEVDPLNRILAEMGRGATALDYLATEEWMHGFMRRMEEWFASGFDLLLTPTLPEPPPMLGTLRPTPENALEVGERATRLACFTSPFNLSGEPAISLPLSWSPEGLPIGVQLAAPWGREDRLIRVAAQLEEASPWRERIPPVSTWPPAAVFG